MKKILVLLILGIIFSSNTEAKKIDGQILFDNDTVDVIFKIPVDFLTQEINYTGLQYKVKYIDSTGKKKKLLPDDAREIRFSFDYENIRMLSRKNTVDIGNIFSGANHIFLKIKIDGKLKLFEYHYTQSEPAMRTGASGGVPVSVGMSYPVEKYVLQKNGEELKRPKELTFRKDMTTYFSDCSVLSQKIEEKEYKKRDLESIVRFYNSNCGE